MRGGVWRTRTGRRPRTPGGGGGASYAAPDIFATDFSAGFPALWGTVGSSPGEGTADNHDIVAGEGVGGSSAFRYTLRNAPSYSQCQFAIGGGVGYDEIYWFTELRMDRILTGGQLKFLRLNGVAWYLQARAANPVDHTDKPALAFEFADNPSDLAVQFETGVWGASAIPGRRAAAVNLADGSYHKLLLHYRKFGHASGREAARCWVDEQPVRVAAGAALAADNYTWNYATFVDGDTPSDPSWLVADARGAATGKIADVRICDQLSGSVSNVEGAFYFDNMAMSSQPISPAGWN